MRIILPVLFVLLTWDCTNSKPTYTVLEGKASGKHLELSQSRVTLLAEDRTTFGPVEITGFQYSDYKMYILDSYMSQQAYIFNEDGRLDHFVYGPGQGPGEYRRPGGFCRSGDRIHLTTGSIYNLYDRDGNFLKSCPHIITGGIPSRSHPGLDSSAYYTTYSRDAPKATIYHVSKEGKLLRSFSPVDEEYALFWDMVLPLGLVIVKQDEILQIFIHKYEVKIFSLTGQLEKKINLSTTIYNPPDFEAARKLGPDKRRWSEFAKKYTLVNNFFPLSDGYVTGLVFTTLEKDQEVLELWDKDFKGLGRCLVPEDEQLVGTKDDKLVFYNGDTHMLSFRAVQY